MLVTVHLKLLDQDVYIGPSLFHLSLSSSNVNERLSASLGPVGLF